MPEERQEGQGAMFSNQGYDAVSALQIRLDTAPILDNIEMFLRGERVIYKKGEDGSIIQDKLKLGEAKANELGIQSILTVLTGIINPQVVQGNFDKPTYYHFVETFHIDFATQVVANCRYWEIKENDMDMIVDFVMNIVSPFMSRVIDNKERDSYAATIRTSEVRSENAGGFKLPFFGNKRKA